MEWQGRSDGDYGEPNLLRPPPSPLTSISIAPLLTIGMVTSWIIKIRRKDYMIVWWGQEEKASREQKPRDGVGRAVPKTPSAWTVCYRKKRRCRDEAG